MVSALHSRSSGPGASPGRGTALFLSKTLYSHSVVLHPGRVEIPLATSSYRNRDNLQPDGSLGSAAAFIENVLNRFKPVPGPQIVEGKQRQASRKKKKGLIHFFICPRLFESLEQATPQSELCIFVVVLLLFLDELLVSLRKFGLRQLHLKATTRWGFI